MEYHRPINVLKSLLGVGRTIHSRGLRIPYDRRIISRDYRRKLRVWHYERTEIKAIQALVQPGDVVLELGAGIGYVSAFLAKNCRVREIHCFEANPELLPFIESVHRENGVEGIRIHHAVLGAEAGSAPFYIREKFVSSSLEPGTAAQQARIRRVEQVEVRPARAAMDAIAPSFLVCDIEGAEAEILPLLDLAGLRGAVIELHPQWIGQAGVAAVFETMARAGLTFYPDVSRGKVAAFLRDW